MKPKSLLSLLLVVAATFQVAATDLFHAEDFILLPGDTAQMEILLDNEAQYTAFQADLYLPDGVTLVPQSVALTGRKAADHTLATSTLLDGATRLMSYSMGLRPYSGTSGALVTLRLAADETLSGPVTIELKNVLFTTTAGMEILLDNTACTVNTFMLGDVNGDRLISITDITYLIRYVLDGYPLASVGLSADLDGDGLLNITDVTYLIRMVLNG